MNLMKINYFLNKYKNHLIYLFIMSIEYNIKDVSSVENEKFDYDDILNLVDVSIEEKNNKENEDMKLALEVFYNENYKKTDLEKIAEYYRISKRKKRKHHLIKDIVKFECNVENEYITNRRKTMWYYINELENDEIMCKYVVFN